MTWNLRLTPWLLTAAIALAGCSDDGSSSTADDFADAAGGSGDAAGSADADVDAGATDAGGGVCAPTPERCGDADPDLQPPRLSEFGLAYHEGTQTMYVVAGSTAVPPRCERPPAQYVATMWAFDDVCGTWSEVTPDSGPTPRGRMAMAASDDALWLFGGRWREDGSASGAYTMYDELWRYDVAAGTWSMADSGGGPSGRADTAMVYDAEGNQLVLFGGNSSTSGLNFNALNDTWIFDIDDGTWSEVSTLESPRPRLYHGQAWDPGRRWMVIYGGGDNDAFNPAVPYMADLWAFDVAEGAWIELAPSAGAPEGRFWGEIVYDPGFDSYVIFGGHDATDLGNRNDIWEFRMSDEQWAALATGDTYQNPATGVCDFPADFTDVDVSLPERRSAHAMVWSETCGHGLLFGGKTDCGAINDVWRLVDGVFVEAMEATDGEVCHRFRANPDNCVNLCF